MAEKVLRIGLDARALSKQRTGVERMLFHFLDSLAAVQPQYEYLLFVDKPLGNDLFSKAPYRIIVEPLKFPTLQRFFDFWLAFQLRDLIRRHQVEVFFSPHTKFPFVSIPCYTTVHGLEWFFYPSGYGLLEKIKQWTWFRLCTKYSAGIVTFAENTAADIKKICRHLEIPVCVSHEGVDGHFRMIGREEVSPQVLEKFRIRKPFIVSVCSLDPRKNLDSVILAFAELVKEENICHQLVLVGKSGGAASRLHRLAEMSGLGEQVRFTGYVGDEELLQLYNQAELFIYPSKYEGFGLPVIEAMACGTPVITSNVSSLPEIAHGAALLVDPYSISEIKSGIFKCLSDHAFRESLKSTGIERAKKFSWFEMTQKILKFMQEERVSG